jgi:hypothetical protein
MKLRVRPDWQRMAMLSMSEVVSVPAAAGSAGAVPRSARAAAVSRCTAAHVQVWFGLGLGGGTLGSTYYPLEFSNVGPHACTLKGYPGVSAFGTGGAQIGPPAIRNGRPHGTVTLAPGATAHAILRVVDWGNLCSTEVPAAGLKVFPPGATRSEPVPFSFGACAHQGVLEVGPINAGVGIPGYTTS